VDLQEYNYEIQDIPEKDNAPPDALSRQLGADKGQEDNHGVVVLPPEKFKMATIGHIMTEGKVHVPSLNEVK
jgi:hypothetical protein